MDKRFRGKIAVVTGAGGRNIGRALAVGFAREGARTVLVGRTESSLADVAAEIEALDGECMVAPADVSAEADVLRVFSEIAEQFGAVDILLNNAAQNLKCDTVDTDVQDWDRVMKPFQDADGYLKREYRGYNSTRQTVSRIRHDLSKSKGFFDE